MANNNKRPRSEELNQLDDSMQSLVSEFKTKENRNVEDLCQFMASYIEKSEDYRRTICEIHHQHIELQKRVEVVESKFESQNDKIQENLDHVELVERDLKETKESGLETESSVHKIEQKQIDKHIFISGFPSKPDEDEVMSSLLALYEIPETSVDYKYSYQFTPRKSTPKATSTPSTSTQQVKMFHQMVIAFKDNQSKSKFMKAKKEKGPVAYEQLTKKHLGNDDAKAIIRCVNRLSKFNLKVQREMLTAKNQQKIFNFQLHNGVFRMKISETSGWKIIDTETALQPYASKENNNPASKGQK